jgi:hypothetical protein
VFEAYRNSASPTANDEIGELDFTGNSSTGVKRLYGGIDAIILDPSNGSEDGVIRLLAIVNGTLTAALTAGQGVQIGAPAGGDKGSGTLNLAAGLYLDGSSAQLRIQKVSVSTAAFDSTSSNIPFDDTLPQNTEGKQLFSQSFTPLSASSTIRIRGVIHAGVNSTADCKIAGFSSAAGSAAIFATEATIMTGGMLDMPIFHEEPANNTTSRTYSLRYGPAAGETMQINGVGGARKLGGALTSYMVIEEWF